MSIPLRDCVYDHSGTTGSVRLLLVTLANWSTRDGSSAPRPSSLLRAVGLDRRGLQRTIQVAVDAGRLRVERGGGRHRWNVYYVLCRQPELHETAVPAPPFQANRGVATALSDDGPAETAVPAPPETAVHGAGNSGGRVLQSRRLGLKDAKGREPGLAPEQNGAAPDDDRTAKREKARAARLAAREALTAQGLVAAQNTMEGPVPAQPPPPVATSSDGGQS